MSRPQTKRAGDGWLKEHEEWLREYEGDNVTPIQPPVTRSPSVNDPDEFPEECVVEEHAWLPEGNYFATYAGHALKKKYRGFDDKLVIEFSIVQSDFNGEIVRGFFIVEILADYKYRARGGSRWVREMRSMFPELGRKRAPAVSMLKGRTIEVRVGDAKDKKGNPLPEDMRWSVVREMLRVVT